LAQPDTFKVNAPVAPEKVETVEKFQVDLTVLESEPTEIKIDLDSGDFVQVNTPQKPLFRFPRNRWTLFLIELAKPLGE